MTKASSMPTPNSKNKLAKLMACQGHPNQKRAPQAEAILTKALMIPKQATNGFENRKELSLKPLATAKNVTKATEYGRKSKALPIFWASSFSRLLELTAYT